MIEGFPFEMTEGFPFEMTEGFPFEMTKEVMTEEVMIINQEVRRLVKNAIIITIILIIFYFLKLPTPCPSSKLS
jgi:hypothetical protein